MSFKKIIPLDSNIRVLYHLLRAIIASVLYGFPSKNMVIIGITGTNGKTTTTHLIAHGLKHAGKKVCMISTVSYMIGEKEYRNDMKMTSPDPFILQKILYEAKKENCEIAVIETSSHALFYHRVWGIHYDIAVLTNITQDHLDLHRTMENYVKTKALLFSRLMYCRRKPGIKKTAVINIGSEYKEIFLSYTYDSLITYGFLSDATLCPENIHMDITGIHFDVRIPGDMMHITSSLIGKYNVLNILASIGVFISLGYKPKEIESMVRYTKWVPGRLEEVKNPFWYKIFVDYAHTPDALENVLLNIRQISWINRIITVFWATGDRDRSKRPLMGKVVSQYSDVIILTQDDDYTESTFQIIQDVQFWIERKEGEDFWVIHDRKDAIRTALMIAKPYDVVLVAWKWDEHVMVTNKWPIPYNDKETILEILKEIDENTIIE